MCLEINFTNLSGVLGCGALVKVWGGKKKGGGKPNFFQNLREGTKVLHTMTKFCEIEFGGSNLAFLGPFLPYQFFGLLLMEN